MLYRAAQTGVKLVQCFCEERSNVAQSLDAAEALQDKPGSGNDSCIFDPFDGQTAAYR
jgi:hypothetical protein